MLGSKAWIKFQAWEEVTKVKKLLKEDQEALQRLQKDPSTCARDRGTTAIELGPKALKIGQLLNVTMAGKVANKQGSPSKSMEPFAEGGQAIIILLDALSNFFASSTSIALGSKSEKATLIRSAAQVLEEDLKRY